MNPLPRGAKSPEDVPRPACQHTISVTTSAALASAVAAAMPGDCIALADGAYQAFKASCKGTAAAPIVIFAKNRGQAKISTGQIVLQGAQYLVLEGLKIATPSTMKMIDCQHCRLSRCTLALTVQDDWVLVYGANSPAPPLSTRRKRCASVGAASTPPMRS